MVQYWYQMMSNTISNIEQGGEAKNWRIKEISHSNIEQGGEVEVLIWNQIQNVSKHSQEIGRWKE